MIKGFDFCAAANSLEVGAPQRVPQFPTLDFSFSIKMLAAQHIPIQFSNSLFHKSTLMSKEYLSSVEGYDYHAVNNSVQKSAF